MKRFIEQIIRVIQWIPIIWKTHDWDYQYSVDVFKYQLARTANYIEKYQRYTHSKTDVQKIRTAIKLMDKIYDEEYACEYQTLPNFSSEQFHASINKQEKAHRILWKFVEHNIRNWWD